MIVEKVPVDMKIVECISPLNFISFIYFAILMMIIKYIRFVPISNKSL